MARRDEVLLDVVRKNRAEALDISGRMGEKRLLELLRKADRDLTDRLAQVSRSAGGPGRGTFTHAQLESTRRQVREVARGLSRGLGKLVVEQGHEAADASAGHLVDYLGRAEKAFRGVASRPLALREASILDAAVSGADATVLRRLASSEAEGDQPARTGILQRYGLETVSQFEDVLQVGLVARKPWAEVRADLVEKSPFLQGAPRHWAERIVRTETMAAYNHAAWEGQRAANEELGDLVKILAAHFDDRTSWDSFQVHGQIRRNEEPFVWAKGLYMYPPNRPNDREVTVPHRISWPIPPTLAWRSNEEAAARWKAEGRKGPMPARPNPMTTIPLDRFGRS